MSKALNPYCIFIYILVHNTQICTMALGSFTLKMIRIPTAIVSFQLRSINDSVNKLRDGSNHIIHCQ